MGPVNRREPWVGFRERTCTSVVVLLRLIIATADDYFAEVGKGSEHVDKIFEVLSEELGIVSFDCRDVPDDLIALDGGQNDRGEEEIDLEIFLESEDVGSEAYSTHEREPGTSMPTCDHDHSREVLANHAAASAVDMQEVANSVDSYIVVIVIASRAYNNPGLTPPVVFEDVFQRMGVFQFFPDENLDDVEENLVRDADWTGQVWNL